MFAGILIYAVSPELSKPPLNVVRVERKVASNEVTFVYMYIQGRAAKLGLTEFFKILYFERQMIKRNFYLYLFVRYSLQKKIIRCDYPLRQ